MTREYNELKAGAFIVITFVLAVAVLVWIKGPTVGPAQSHTVAFRLSDDVGGLRVGDDVRLGGYKIGIVQEIHPEGLDTADPKLLVNLSIPAHYVLHHDAVVAIQTGLTGATNLNIESLGTGAPLAPGAVMAGKPDPKTDLFAIVGRLGPQLEGTLAEVRSQTIPRVNQAVDSAKALIQHANQKVDPIVDRYNKVADSASGAMSQAGDLLGDTKPDIRGTLKNLNAASGTIKDKLPGIADQVTAVIAKVDTSLTTAQSALEDVQKTAANAKDTTATLRSLIVENRSKFDSMIGSIKTTSDNLKTASIEIRRSPWRLLYKPTPGEAANLNLYDSAREFADGAGSLSDAAGALRDALHDPQADRAQLQKLVHQLDASFNQFHQVESRLWLTAKQ